MWYIVTDAYGDEYGFFSNPDDAYELANTIEGTTVYEEEEE